MKRLNVTLNRQPCNVTVTDNLDILRSWIEGRGRVSVDTETTGLNIFSTGYRLRLLIVGNEDEAYVVPMEGNTPGFHLEAGDILKRHAEQVPLTFHNATFDRLVMDRCGVMPLEALTPAMWDDTRIMAHLIDPRAKQEGGQGHGLKDLSDLMIDPHASGEGQKVLKELFRVNKWTKGTGWAEVPLDNHEYLRYGGLDGILTTRLFNILRPRIADLGLQDLLVFEKEVADLCARIQRKGLLVDGDYVATELLPWLEADEADGVAEAAGWGVTNVNSTAQVAEALQGLGWVPEEFTAGGAPKVDKTVLGDLAEQGNAVAAAVMKAKRAGKFKVTYAEHMLEDVDSEGRIHPMINPLQARTARMSVSNPPLQQLPSNDWRIRKAIVADPGKVLWTCDYDQIEMRVLAGMAGETNMKSAIANGLDLHDYTAEMVFGKDFTKADRKLGKAIGFGKVYGGGAVTIARQSGAPEDDVRRAMQAYDAAYPGLKRFQRQLADRATVGKRQVMTGSGRPLPLDGDRLYAATNYVVQSTSRDVLAQAMLALDEAGIDMLMPIHDEVLGQCSADEYEDVGRVISDCMSMDLYGVRLTAGAELVGTNWGMGYGGV